MFLIRFLGIYDYNKWYFIVTFISVRKTPILDKIKNLFNSISASKAGTTKMNQSIEEYSSDEIKQFEIWCNLQ